MRYLLDPSQSAWWMLNWCSLHVKVVFVLHRVSVYSQLKISMFFNCLTSPSPMQLCCCHQQRSGLKSRFVDKLTSASWWRMAHETNYVCRYCSWWTKHLQWYVTGCRPFLHCWWTLTCLSFRRFNSIILVSALLGPTEVPSSNPSTQISDFATDDLFRPPKISD